jgi:hypothetical protein
MDEPVSSFGRETWIQFVAKAFLAIALPNEED